MKLAKALESGFAGASAVTLVHEIVRRKLPNAPRLDLLGMNALSKVLNRTLKKKPEPNKLFGWTLAGDIISTTVYYSLAGIGKRKGSILRGMIFGLAAGIGAVVLPKPMGLTQSYSNRTMQTKIMTIAWYVIGGLVTGAVLRLVEGGKDKETADQVF